jgi:hypothetical protein
MGHWRDLVLCDWRRVIGVLRVTRVTQLIRDRVIRVIRMLDITIIRK